MRTLRPLIQPLSCQSYHARCSLTFLAPSPLGASLSMLCEGLICLSYHAPKPCRCSPFRCLNCPLSLSLAPSIPVSCCHYLLSRSSRRAILRFPTLPLRDLKISSRSFGNIAGQRHCSALFRDRTTACFSASIGAGRHGNSVQPASQQAINVGGRRSVQRGPFLVTDCWLLQVEIVCTPRLWHLLRNQCRCARASFCLCPRFY